MKSLIWSFFYSKCFAELSPVCAIVGGVLGQEIIKVCNNLGKTKLTLLYKVYKAISDSLENCKIINCIVFSIILNYILFIIKLWVGSLCAWNLQQIHKICTEKTPSCTMFYSDSI